MPIFPFLLETLTRRRRSVATVVVATLVAISTLVLGGVAAVSHRQEYVAGQARLEAKLRLITDQLATSLALPVWNFDRAQAAKVLEGAMADQEVQQVVLVFGSQPPEAMVRTRGAQWEVLSATGLSSAAPGPSRMERAIEFAGEDLGRIQVTCTDRFLRAELLGLLARRLMSLAAFALLLVASLTFLLWHLVLHPLEEVERFALAMRSGREDTPEPRGRYLGELDSLRTSIVQTLALLHQRFEAEQKLSMVVEQSPVSILVTDPQGLIEYANPQFSDVSGYSVKEVLGRDLWSLQLQGLEASEASRIQDRVQAGFPWRGEMAWTRRDGQPLWEEVSISCLMDPSGRISHLIWTKEDHTEQRRTEASRAAMEAQLFQAQKMEALGQLAGGIAHDINNMLTAILGHLGLLKDKLEGVPGLEVNLGGILKAAERSRDIAAKILAFSRKQEARCQVLDLNAQLEALMATCLPLLGEDVSIRFHPERELWKMSADPSQLDQVAMNLMVNARDAMPTGGTLTIGTRNEMVDASFCHRHPHSMPGNYVVLRVEDTGTGMDASTLARIFEPFFTTKLPGRGTGLGLSTLYGVVQQNGGFVTVSSTPGVGTRFEVFFPRFRAFGEEAPAPAAPPTHQLAHGERILVVEDDDILRIVIPEMLAGLGYRPVTVPSSEEALAVAQRQGPDLDLLLTDIVMAGMDGIALRNRMMELRPGLPVVFMSGYTDEMLARRGLEEDGISLLRKPFTQEELGVILGSALAARHP